ncbi:L-threonylcarbamoyladenylate synthase [Legionella septentrionalis]|uniref:L-threonylcarbamoyladenylate synthase n=1 Tax=Legionella septentrionalis TaxID=2498109 RepID=UPI000F8DF7E8|nr:L-threonylcarbamoyladenylate synthase [Legionella septentrionalis]RUR10772.1 threonylcarbamoyl-AMP synthase [Legionella septentrionalis]
MAIITDFNKAHALLEAGKILAYPTEAVYGLGCDPYNREAVEKILALKKRPANKGLILLIAQWQHLLSLIKPLSAELLAPVQQSWPGPVTWIFPKAAQVPDWLSSDGETIAIRLSAHPVAHQLCKEKPIVSTSANLSGAPPARTLAELLSQFPAGLDAIMAGELGGEKQPSAIYEVLSGKRLR